MPRTQLRKQYEAGQISLDMTKAIQGFCRDYTVREEFVLDYLRHLQELQWAKRGGTSSAKLTPLTRFISLSMTTIGHFIREWRLGKTLCA